MQCNKDLIWVNEDDQMIGSGEKLRTHVEGRLHRAFSIFILDCDTGRMLLQRRARGKYHSGGLWTNACCSHPRVGEKVLVTINNRIYEELGFRAGIVRTVNVQEYHHGAEDAGTLYYCGSFIYYHDFGNLSENELDHVYLYRINGGKSVLLDRYDPGEVEELRWAGMDQIMDELEKSPEIFTPWFRQAFTLLLDALPSITV